MYKYLEGFNWDNGNVDKSVKKHGVTPEEAEEVFIDRHLTELEDPAHSITEKRSVVIGKTEKGSILSVVYTIRDSSVRVISARLASRKERLLYETKI